MFYTDSEILSRCRMPDRLPINVSVEEYRARMVGQVRREMRRGASLAEATRKASEPPPKKKGWNRATAAVVACSMAVGAALAGVGAYFYAPHQVSAITAAAPGKIQPIYGTETILVVGEDTRATTDIAGSPEDVPGSRTDMIALVGLSADPGQAVVVSLPRDLKVDRPTCSAYDAEDKTYTGEGVSNDPGVKINSVYEVGGPACLTKTVENLTDVKITRYVQVDFGSFQEVVDAVGGVDIDTDGPIQDEILGTIAESAGEHHMDGRRALDYVRARHVTGTAMNDFERMDRQQQFLFALIEQVRESGGMSNPVSAFNLARSVSPMLTMDGVDLPAAVSMLKTMLDLPPTSIHTATAPVTGEDEYGNLILDKARAAKLFSALASGDTLLGTEQGADPGDITAEVSPRISTRLPIHFTDSTYSDALRIGNALAAEGVDVELIAAETSVAPDTTSLTFGRDDADEAVSVGALIPQVSMSPGEDLALILGEDARLLTVSRIASSGRVHLPPEVVRAAEVIPADIKALSGPTTTGTLGG